MKTAGVTYNVPYITSQQLSPVIRQCMASRPSVDITNVVSAWDNSLGLFIAQLMTGISYAWDFHHRPPGFKSVVARSCNFPSDSWKSRTEMIMTAQNFNFAFKSSSPKCRLQCWNFLLWRPFLSTRRTYPDSMKRVGGIAAFYDATLIFAFRQSVYQARCWLR